jgi:hypothetical protein
MYQALAAIGVWCFYGSVICLIIMGLERFMIRKSNNDSKEE